MLSSKLEDLVTELFQHLEFIDGDWHIDTEQGYVIARMELGEIFDELENYLQNDPRPLFDNDEVPY